MVWEQLLQRGSRHRGQAAHALRGVPLFRDVPIVDLVEIWRHLNEIHVPAGSVICRRGEPGDRFYVIQTGEIDVRLGLDETGILVRRLQPGDFVGEMALLTGAPRSADVVAGSDSILWALDRADFEKLLRRSSSLMLAFNRYLCERISYTTRVLEHRDWPGS